MQSFFAYYFAWIVLSYLLRTPWLLLGIVVVVLLRPFIPSPGALFRLLGRAKGLRALVEVNRANVTARRDLAVLYLDGVRARAAVPLLEEGLALSPNDAELLYLYGLALHRSGRHEDALSPLVRAVELDPRVRYGLPYLVAGDAVAALKRWDAALDAYEHYIAGNSSDVAAFTRLARAQARTGDRDAARATLYEGIRTYGLLPRSMKRRQLGHYLAAQRARVTLLREPGAIVVALGIAVIGALLLGFAYGPVLAFFREPALMPRMGISERRALRDAREKCGKESTGEFAGRYLAKPRFLEEGEVFDEAPYANFEIQKDRIVSGSITRQEWCLGRVVERAPGKLLAHVTWRYGDGDDAVSPARLLLEREGELTLLKLWTWDMPRDSTPMIVELRRR